MYNLFKFNLARNSFRIILKEYKIKKIYIPYYLCNVIKKAVFKEGITPVFYNIDNNFLPSKYFKKLDYILYPNYFGICDKNVELLSKEYPNLIVDNAHSFYSKPQGIASFNSARKFFNVYNGSYLWINKDFETQNIEKDILPLNNSDKLFNEIYFNNEDIKIISKTIEEKLNSIDKNEFIKNRQEKFEILNDKYKEINQINFNSVYCPFCYPLLVKNSEQADLLAETFHKKGITIYRYWGNLPKTYNEYKFYRNLIPIPLDKNE